MTEEQKDKIKTIFHNTGYIEFSEVRNNCEVCISYITKEQIEELLKCDFVKTFDMIPYSDLVYICSDEPSAEGHILLEIDFINQEHKNEQ